MQAPDLDRARDALHWIPPDLDRADWVRAGMAAHAAGLSFDDFDQWSAGGGSYKAPEARATWRSFKTAPGGVGIGSLFAMAKDHGWSEGHKPQPRPAQAHRKPVEPPRKPAQGMGATEVWERCVAATNGHGYISSKRAAGVPLGNLRVLPDADPLRIAGEGMGGSLVIPAHGPDGELATLQFVTTGATADRLKAAGKPTKLNLPGASVKGWHTVGEIKPGMPLYLCEGIGQAWACWQATGNPAVVAFGAGNMARVATEIHRKDDAARLVLVADSGKEQLVQDIAAAVGGQFVLMPEGEVSNFDANDLMQRDGTDVLEQLLRNAAEPPKPAPRYKLLGADDLRSMPPLAWRVRGVLPAMGLAALFGPSASGKSFLALDMAAAIAEGHRWFDCRVIPAPVVYCALEGEAGFKLRAQAWEASRGRALPDGLRLMLQSFSLTDVVDVADLAAVVPAGAVVVLDTLNRAAPTADENSSKDMGEILQSAKTLQALTNGLVVLVHHTGKNAAAGLRGHSSLFAAMDAAIEVSRDGDRREWRVAKSKDGIDGDAHPFKLQVETLGTDEDGDEITSCVVAMDSAVDDVRRVKLPQGGNQRLVYEGIRTLFKDGHTGKPGAPPLRPCIELEAAVLAGAARLTCATDRRATRTREAITGLVARGVLGLNEGWLWTA